MLKRILFDFDGTLADTREAAFLVSEKLAEKHGMEKLPREKMEELKDLSLREKFKTMEIPLSRVPRLYRDARFFFRELIDDSPPVPGIKNVLEELSARGLGLDIISSNDRENINRFLRNTGLERYFEHVIPVSGLFGKHRVIKRFLRKCGIAAEEALYVGDEVRDIQACKKVPLWVVAVGWGYDTKPPLQRAEPDFLIDEPEELIRIVKKLERQ